MIVQSVGLLINIAFAVFVVLAVLAGIAVAARRGRIVLSDRLSPLFAARGEQAERFVRSVAAAGRRIGGAEPSPVRILRELRALPADLRQDGAAWLRLLSDIPGIASHELMAVATRGGIPLDEPLDRDTVIARVAAALDTAGNGDRA